MMAAVLEATVMQLPEVSGVNVVNSEAAAEMTAIKMNTAAQRYTRRPGERALMRIRRAAATQKNINYILTGMPRPFKSRLMPSTV